ncbi:hypothetical protein AB0395_02650 [Streptosporangium sp. NPDC051023]|uniref:hypothetical protein n=1 Tax=Streptosporangium sp. NPDC051023 TaxID=3155410 RepID=UPI003450F267
MAMMKAAPTNIGRWRRSCQASLHRLAALGGPNRHGRPARLDEPGEPDRPGLLMCLPRLPYRSRDAA